VSGVPYRGNEEPGTDAAHARADLFREAMASFPSGITIVTTVDAAGRWWGFTATAFCALSIDPPLVLVCLSTSAECYPVFDTAKRWVVNVIHPDHADLAIRFATRGADKFADAGFLTDEHGLPYLDSACVVMRCSAHAQYPGGDHEILVGHVDDVQVNAEQAPAVYFRRVFRALNLPV
jgi:flavin reductase ActVB